MTRESTIEATLPDGRKVRFRPQQHVHVQNQRSPIRALELLKARYTILPCCIRNQEPHEGSSR